jgi:hypothetical protein
MKKKISRKKINKKIIRKEKLKLLKIKSEKRIKGAYCSTVASINLITDLGPSLKGKINNDINNIFIYTIYSI